MIIRKLVPKIIQIAQLIVFLGISLQSQAAGLAKANPHIDRILVSKSTNTLELISGDGVVRSYRVSLGRKSSDGPKERQGDERTPEGIYHIVAHQADSQFHRALRLDYPNRQDRDRARSLQADPGGDIMIHGFPNDLKGWGLPEQWQDSRWARFHYLINWTAGCLAVTNSEIDEIFAWVKDGTEVEIRP